MQLSTKIILTAATSLVLVQEATAGPLVAALGMAGILGGAIAGAVCKGTNRCGRSITLAGAALIQDNIKCSTCPARKRTTLGLEAVSHRRSEARRAALQHQVVSLLRYRALP